MKVIHENIAMVIIGNHFHHGELCHPTGENPKTITQTIIDGQIGYFMSLVNCEHGIGECWVPRDQLKLLWAHETKEN